MTTRDEEIARLASSLAFHLRARAGAGWRVYPAGEAPPPLAAAGPAAPAPPAARASAARPPTAGARRAPAARPAAPARTRPGGGDPADELAALAAEAAGCRACGLARARTLVVFGEGDPSARIMFVGEGPGLEEDRTGRPFVGPAGQLLDRMIGAMGLSRDQVYIANVVKCRPPGNRQPLPDESGACRRYLDRQIELVAPEAIVLLGATAMRAIFPETRSITAERGKWREHTGVPVMPTFHPAYLLRNQSEKLRVWEDLKEVLRRLELPVPANPADRRRT